MVSHPKHAKLRPEMEWKKAQADVADKQVELQAAKNHYRRCELMEGDAMANWISVNPPPSAEAVYRDKIAKEQAARIERIAAGLPAEPPKAPSHGRSELDRIAASRGKNAGSLRSTVVRR
jgi:hypothetical protein